MKILRLPTIRPIIWQKFGGGTFFDILKDKYRYAYLGNMGGHYPKNYYSGIFSEEGH
jgi:hypothetical protein